MTPSEVASLIASQIAVYGNPITMSRGGTHTTYTVMTDHANAQVISTYFDDNTAAGLVHPVMVIYLDATCSGTNNPPQNLDSFTFGARNYSCQMIAAPFLMAGVPVLYVVLAS